VALLALAISISACHAPQRVMLTLSVAASVKDAILEAEAAYLRDHAGIDFRNNFGSSGTLAREIEEGAPVDAFISAASKPVDDLEANGLIAPGTRRNLLRNSLVLIAPRDSRLRDFHGLTDPSVRLIALGRSRSVPAGQYGRQTLAALHLLDRLNQKLVLEGMFARSLPMSRQATLTRASFTQPMRRPQAGCALSPSRRIRHTTQSSIPQPLSKRAKMEESRATSSITSALPKLKLSL